MKAKVIVMLVVIQNKKKIQALFTLGSVYCTSASGAEQTIDFFMK